MPECWDRVPLLHERALSKTVFQILSYTRNSSKEFSFTLTLFGIQLRRKPRLHPLKPYPDSPFLLSIQFSSSIYIMSAIFDEVRAP